MIKYQFGIQAWSYVMCFRQSRILCQRHHNDGLMTGSVLIRHTDFGKENISLSPLRENVSWHRRQYQFTGINPAIDITWECLLNWRRQCHLTGKSTHWHSLRMSLTITLLTRTPGCQPVTQLYCGINTHTHSPSLSARPLSVWDTVLSVDPWPAGDKRKHCDWSLEDEHPRTL